jgi:hypothetical protein
MILLAWSIIVVASILDIIQLTVKIQPMVNGIILTIHQCQKAPATVIDKGTKAALPTCYFTHASIDLLKNSSVYTNLQINNLLILNLIFTIMYSDLIISLLRVYCFSKVNTHFL